MRRLHRKTLYSQDNSLDVRVEQLERRYATPELEYVLVNFNTLGGAVNAGTSIQLPMTDDEFPKGQYGSAAVSTSGPNFYGYSIIDDYIQCNSFGKDGFWHLFTSLLVNTNGPAAAEDTDQIVLIVQMELWDTDDAFAGTYDPVWSAQIVDNRTDYAAGTLSLRTHTLFFNGGITNTLRARFMAELFNDSASNITASPGSFTMIRYGNAIGQITSSLE